MKLLYGFVVAASLVVFSLAVSVFRTVALAFKESLPSPDAGLFLSTYHVDTDAAKSRADAYQQRALAHRNYRAGHFAPARSLC